MAGPIRWDTIQGRSPLEGAGVINSAAQLINGGFAQLKGILQDQNNLATENQQVAVRNNTNDAMKQLMAVRTAGEYDTAMKGGMLERILANKQMDQAAVLGFADKRMGELQQRDKVAIEYGHAMKDEATAADVQAFQTARMNKNPAAMEAAMQSYMSKGGRDPSALLKFADMRDWEIQQRGMTLDKHQSGILTDAAQRTHFAASDANGARQAAAAEISAGASVQNAATNAQNATTNANMSQFQIESATEAKNAAQAAAKAAAWKTGLVEKGNPYAAEGKYTGKQATELQEAMTKAGIGDDAGERSAVIDRLDQIRQKGVTFKKGKESVTIKDIPMAYVRAAIMGSGDDVVNMWNQGYANNVEENLKRMLRERTEYTKEDGTRGFRPKLADDLFEYTGGVDKGVDSPMPVKPYDPSKKRK